MAFNPSIGVSDFNLSMMRYFFERSAEDRSSLFEGLEVFEAGPRYRGHFGRYPVVFLSFRDVKASCWEDAWAAIQRKIREAFIEHRSLHDHGGSVALAT